LVSPTAFFRPTREMFFQQQAVRFGQLLDTLKDFLHGFAHRNASMENCRQSIMVGASVLDSL
jgi:hypothetical protein